jgi:hypothetical protein
VKTVLETKKMSEQLPGIVWSERSESIAKIAAAYVKFQSEVEAVKKGSANPFFKSKYADLSAVREAIREPLANNGLAILQEPGPTVNGMVSLTTTLLHTSGEYMRSTLTLSVTKADAQGCGSGITYARRYAMQSVAGVTPEDDDGNAASGNHPQQPAAPSKPAKRPTTPAPQQATGPVFYSTDSLTAEQALDAGMWLEGAGAKRVRAGLYTAPKKIGPYSKTDKLLVPKPSDLTQKEQMDAVFEGDDMAGVNL